MPNKTKPPKKKPAAKKKAPAAKKSAYKPKFLKMGRPAAFTSHTELLEDMDRYFVECKGRGRGWKEKPTKAGLALFLGVNKDTLNEYAKGTHGKDFSGAIKAAYGVIEKAWLSKLDEAYPTGGIFYLKNAFKEDYRDRYDHTTDGKELPAPQIIIYGEGDPLKAALAKQPKK